MAKGTRGARFYRGADSGINLSKGSGFGVKADDRPTTRGGSLKSEDSETQYRDAKELRRRNALGRSIGEVKRHRDEQLDELSRRRDSNVIGKDEYHAERARIFRHANSEIAKLKAAPPLDGTSEEEVAETRRRIEGMRARKAEKGRKKLADKIASANKRFERGEIDVAERDRIIVMARQKYGGDSKRHSI